MSFSAAVEKPPPTHAGSGSGHMDTSSLFFLYLHSSQMTCSHSHTYAHGQFTVYTVFPTSCCLSPTIQAAHPPLCLHPPFSACHAFFISVHSLTSFTRLTSALLHTASPRSTLLRAQCTVSEHQCIVGHDPFNRTHFSAATQTARYTFEYASTF